MIRQTQLSAAKSRWSKIVYTWTDELIRRWCYELPFHIQVQEASCFFIFLNQITSGFKHLFSSLTGLARNPILVILGTLSCYIRSQISWGSWVQGDEQKLLLSLCVFGIMVTAVSSLLCDSPVPCRALGLGGGGGVVGGQEEHRNTSYNTSFARGSVCHSLDSETAGYNLQLLWSSEGSLP